MTELCKNGFRGCPSVNTMPNQQITQENAAQDEFTSILKKKRHAPEGKHRQK